MVFFIASAKLFAKFPWAWMSVHVFRSEIITIPFRFRLHYCLVGENGEWVVKTPQTHSWMKLAALRANSRERMRKLSNFDRSKPKHLNGFLCIHRRPKLAVQVTRLSMRVSYGCVFMRSGCFERFLSFDRYIYTPQKHPERIKTQPQ